MAKKRSVRITTSISVPPDLKRRMDQVREPINWSAVACEAFNEKLAEIAKKKEIEGMNDVVERLRASKREAENSEYTSGHETGETWAKKEATARHLQRLAKWHNGIDNDQWREFSEWDSKEDVANALYYEIEPEMQGDDVSAKDFWDHYVDVEGVDYLRGFVEGALSVWEAVKKEL